MGHPHSRSAGLLWCGRQRRGGDPRRASAAREWVLHQQAQGIARPKAPTTREILGSVEIDVAAGEAAVLIPVLIDEGRTVRANLTFDAGLLGAIDAAASERGLTRSAFLASAARENAAVKS